MAPQQKALIPDLIQALEALAGLARVRIEQPLILVARHELVVHEPRALPTAHRHAERIMPVVLHTFRVILDYLKQFYQEELRYRTEEAPLRTMKAMMRLADSATRKLPYQLARTKEFHDLAAFYSKNIEPLAVQAPPGKWIQPLPVKALLDATKVAPEQQQASHFLLTSGIAQRDSDYELFFMHKADGSRFFPADELNKILRHEHTDNLDEGRSVLRTLQHAAMRKSAQTILKGNWETIRTLMREGEGGDMYSACVALMLATYEHKARGKNSADYFSDYIGFLRDAIESSDVRFIQALWRSIYCGIGCERQMVEFIGSIGPSAGSLTEKYAAISEYVRHWHALPLVHDLEGLQAGLVVYDPLLMLNIPTACCSVQFFGKPCSIIRLPTPTHQEYINKAHIADEFVQAARNGSQLLLNFQNRLSWKESARCTALEGLKIPNLTVVSMTKESAFYSQSEPYHDLTHADLFIEQLLDHLHRDNAGYCYPTAVRKALFPRAATNCARAIHEQVFNSKNVLSLHERLDFIELFYLALQLKMVELLQPDVLYVCCKDGLDIALPAMMELVRASAALGYSLPAIDLQRCEALLFGESLMLRGRMIAKDRFERMARAIKLLESWAQIWRA